MADVAKLSTSGAGSPEEVGVVYKIPVSDFKPHPLNPYHVRNDDAMQELAASIQKHGVLVPVIARRKDDGLELIAGHRRQHAAQMIGLEVVPVLVLDLDDDDAIIQLVDSNIQREGVLPSERAWAYKLRMDAMKHKAGRPTKEDEENFVSIDEIEIILNEHNFTLIENGLLQRMYFDGESIIVLAKIVCSVSRQLGTASPHCTTTNNVFLAADGTIKPCMRNSFEINVFDEIKNRDIVGFKKKMKIFFNTVSVLCPYEK